MEEHDTIIDKNNKKSIEFERSVSRETQKQLMIKTTYFEIPFKLY